MYVIFEYAVCVALTLAAGTLLFGTCVAILMIQEGARLLAGFVRAFLHPGAPVVRPTPHLSMQGR